MNEKKDRLRFEVIVDYNKPVSPKRMEYLLEEIQEAIENKILESEKLTKEIGHVFIGNPFGDGLEICV
jgi:hypothetical protein